MKEFWEPMEVHMAQLHCIEEGKALRVANYPFRSSTSAPDSGNPLLRKLRVALPSLGGDGDSMWAQVLRDVQARESIWLAGCSLLVEEDALNPIRVCSGQEDYLVNWGKCRWERPQPPSGTTPSTCCLSKVVV